MNSDLYVLVLTNTELGWDCVVGVYADTEENRGKFEDWCKKEDSYVMSRRKVNELYDLDD